VTNDVARKALFVKIISASLLLIFISSPVIRGRIQEGESHTGALSRMRS
jgi:hypothetical protein